MSKYELTEEQYAILVANINQPLGYLKVGRNLSQEGFERLIKHLEIASKVLTELLPESEKDIR